VVVSGVDCCVVYDCKRNNIVTVLVLRVEFGQTSGRGKMGVQGELVLNSGCVSWIEKKVGALSLAPTRGAWHNRENVKEDL
jgi:hypothetical protein